MTAQTTTTETTAALLAYFSNLRTSARTPSTNPNASRSALPPNPNPNAYRSNHHLARSTVAEFAHYYGENTTDLSAWQAILSTCAFPPEAIPDTLEGCKSLFYTSVHVNIFDLVDATKRGLKTKSFLFAADLAVYSRATGRIFPVEVAREGTLCRAMLRRF